MTLIRLAQKVAKLQDEALADPRRRSLVRARLEAGSALRGGPADGGSRRSIHWSWTLGAAALAGVLGFLAGRPSAERTVSGPRAGTWQTASESASLPLEFSDGSEIVLSPRARARVVERDENGARVFLERGRARVAVVHRSSTRWGIEAGPFEVAVTGTRFDMEWLPGDEMLSVRMDEGKVEISGCGLGVRRVATGESVRFLCRAGHAVEDRAADADAHAPNVTPAPPPEPSPVPVTTSERPSGRPPAAPPEVASAPPLAASLRPVVPDSPTPTTAGLPSAPPPLAAAANPSSPAADWRALASNARNLDAFAAVDGAVFDHECENADGPSLLTLANVARLTGHVNHAQRALLALRRRFARTPRAAIAAFDLGMLSADQGHEAAVAARWFGTYLNEAPQGPLAREALGRLIETESQAGNHAAARDAARRYLQRYPTGPRADLAKSLAGHE